MKRILFSLLFSMLTFQYAHAIEIWHTNTSWVGQGMCSASFLIDSQGEEVLDLKLAFTAIDSDNNDVDVFVFNIPIFGDSNATSIERKFWESSTACDDDIRLKVTLASAEINGKKVDLLKTNMLSVRDFRPFEIQIPGRNTEDQISNYTPSPDSQCYMTLDKEDADEIWNQMKADLEGYYNRCATSSAEIAMEYGGYGQQEAIEYGQSRCANEIQDAIACMKQPGAYPQMCICGSDI